MNRCGAGGTIKGKTGQLRQDLVKATYRRMSVRTEINRDRLDVTIRELREEIRNGDDALTAHEETCAQCREVRVVTEEIRAGIVKNAGSEK